MSILHRYSSDNKNLSRSEQPQVGQVNNAGGENQNDRDPIVVLPVRTAKTIQHMASYPLVQQTNLLLNDVVCTRIMLANIKPIISNILNSKPVIFLAPVTNVMDRVGETTLSVTEAVIPSLKTKTYQRLGEEAMIPCNLFKKTVTFIDDKCSKMYIGNVFNPSHNQIKRWRKFYNKYYDTQGKPIFRGSINPLIKPANDQIEKLTQKYLPEGENVDPDNFCCEFDRGLVLSLNVVDRSMNVVKKKTMGKVKLPFKFICHINKVLNEELDKKENLGIKNSFSAIYDTVTKLEKDLCSDVKSRVSYILFADNSPRLPNEEEVSKIITTLEKQKQNVLGA